MATGNTALTQSGVAYLILLPTFLLCFHHYNFQLVPHYYIKAYCFFRLRQNLSCKTA